MFRNTHYTIPLDAIPERASSLHHVRSAQEIRQERLEAKKSQQSLTSVIDLEWFKSLDTMIHCDLEDLERKRADDERKLLQGLLSRAQYEQAEDNYRTQEGRLAADLSLARTNHLDLLKKLQNRSLEPVHGGERSSDAFVDLLLNTYDNHKRSSKDQPKFRTELISTYHSRAPSGKDLWCPVLRCFLEVDLITAAHIFPVFLGEGTMTHIFGKAEMFSPRNGLILSTWIEKKMDKHQLVFVPDHPVKFHNGIIEQWKVRVLDKTLLKQEIPFRRSRYQTFQDLDGQPLEFHSHARPAARYLYYHYVVSLLHARKHRRKGSLEAMSREIAWATPGKYLRESMLIELAQRCGHDVPGELENLRENLISDDEVQMNRSRMSDVVNKIEEFHCASDLES
ncbi:MAG: hypothetical protein M1830_008076 [Pleopsidium flavum]|nr:MAG: hypothetical protein M1830_008076 [Pleopsidium flavum]